MIAIVLVFALIATILFIERSGIKYNYNQTKLDFLPSENVVTKLSANAKLEKNTLVLWDSQQIDSAAAMDEFAIIFSDMNVGYEAVDLSKSPFPDLADYSIVVVVMSDLFPMGENVIVLRDWVHEGGKVLFALTLQKNIYVPT